MTRFNHSLSANKSTFLFLAKQLHPVVHGSAPDCFQESSSIAVKVLRKKSTSLLSILCVAISFRYDRDKRRCVKPIMCIEYLNYSKEEVSSAQRRATNPADIIEVHDLIQSSQVCSTCPSTLSHFLFCINNIPVSIPKEIQTGSIEQNEYETRKGKSVEIEHVASSVDNWSKNNDDFSHHTLQHSQLQTLPETNSLPITDLSVSADISVTSNGSSNGCSPDGSMMRMPIDQNTVTDNQLIEEVRDVLDELNHDLSTEHAETYLYHQMNAVGNHNKALQNRIDNIVSEVHRQSVECFSCMFTMLQTGRFLCIIHELSQGSVIPSGPSGGNKVKKRQSVRIKNLEILDDDENPEIDELTPTAYIENVSRLQKTEEHQRIRTDFQTKMTVLLGGRTKQDLHEETALFECSFDTCPCVERIDLMMKTYAELTNSEDLWRRVPIAPLMTLDDRYLHQQLHDDFVHIKMYHIDRRFQTGHANVEAMNSNMPEDEEIDQKERQNRKKSADILRISENDQKEMEPPDIAREMYLRFSERYPCPDMSICRGFARHYRERGADAQENRLFHINNDQ